ncbi:MAG: hypothetical protein MZW92_79945 [Comamonadaceae bacterium]|nr:hypothetical protein [Comamonadaceae bacterium]
MAHAAAQAPARDLRRHEAARGHRPRAGDGAQDAADGRALRRAGRADPRQAAGRADEDRRHAPARTVVMVTHDVDEAVLLSRPHRDDDQRPGRHHRRGADGGPARPRERVALADEPALRRLPQRGARVPVPAPAQGGAGVPAPKRPDATRRR